MAYSSIRKNKQIISNKGKKNSTLQTSNYQSQKSPKEDKILNALPDYELFISISEAFENSLNQLEVYDNHKEVYGKLLKIEKLLKVKISSLKKLFKERESISENNLKHVDLSQSSESIYTLHSQTSSCSSVSHLNDNSDFLDFMNKVDCPFCSKTQCNKTALIFHLFQECTISDLESDLKKKDSLSYSTFQILPNNTFKCNVCPNSCLKSIKHYFDHAKSFQHTFLFNHEAKTKQFCDSLFCSSCKIAIPNNYTQIYLHINHDAHVNSAPESLGVLLKRGTCFLYNKKKKFKCLVCHTKFTFKTFEQMKVHLKYVHTEKIKQYVLHCEFCSKDVNFSICHKHMSSSTHINNEKKYTENSFELCLYCSFMCDTKINLFLHMKSQCILINDICKRYKILEKSAEQDVKKKTTEEEVDIEEHDKKGNFLIVKGYTNLPELLNYFRQFGNVETIKIYNKRDVLIKFSQKSSIDCVLHSEFSHKINGEILEITANQNYFNDTRKTKKEKDIHSGVSDCNMSLNEKYCDKIEDTDFNFDTQLQNDEELVNLFQRAVNHLMRDKQSVDSGKLLKAAVDETIKVGHCSFVGFLESELSLSAENVSLHVQISETFHDDSTLVEIDPLSNIWMNSYEKLCSSDVWENVKLVNSKLDIPHIKCFHKEIKKPCTITFMRSPKMISRMLRDCVIENDLVRSFCMLVRFWVSVRGLAIKQFDYVLISLLVYFLKSKNIVRKSLESYKYGTRAALLDEAISVESVSSQPVHFEVNDQFLNIKELFQEFMEFLLTFNFGRYAICLPLDYPVPRKFFTMNKSREILSKLSNPDKLEESSMCILDPLIYINLASDIKSSDVRSLLQAASASRKS